MTQSPSLSTSASTLRGLGRHLARVVGPAAVASGVLVGVRWRPAGAGGPLLGFDLPSAGRAAGFIFVLLLLLDLDRRNQAVVRESPEARRRRRYRIAAFAGVALVLVAYALLTEG